MFFPLEFYIVRIYALRDCTVANFWSSFAQMVLAQQAIREMLLLIVDEDDASRCEVMGQFSREGFRRVDGAKSGEEALRELSSGLKNRNPYDLIVLGLGLPQQERSDTFEEIRSIFDIPVVLMVDKENEEAARSVVEPGAVDFLPEPIDLRLLQIIAEKLLTRRFLARELSRSTDRNETLFLNVLAVMAKVLEAKDPYTRHHSDKVSSLSAAVAVEMGFNDEEVRRIGIAGILHDLGKIGIKESILKKPGPLDPKERRVVQRHPVIASTILEPIEQLRGALGYIKYHHEHYDGTGYPEQLSGENIPLGARIIHATEAFDSMISRRSYSVPKTPEEAMSELKRCAGSQFDPNVVKALTRALHRTDATMKTTKDRPTRSLPDLLRDLTGRVAVDDANPSDSGPRSATQGPKPD